MEKDIAKIRKNEDTDIAIRIDDFGGKVGVTIREFVKSERYTGFTKAGTRIPADQFKKFKEAINLIDEEELESAASSASSASSMENKEAHQEKLNGSSGAKGEDKEKGKSGKNQRKSDIEEVEM